MHAVPGAWFELLQVLHAHMTSSAVGAFAETFEWTLEGAAAPVRLEIRGRVVPPALQVRPDRQELCTHVAAWSDVRWLEMCK